MQKSLTTALSQFIENHIVLWRTRRETLVWLVTLIIETGTVNLWRLACHVDTRAQTLSVHRRFERFFQHIQLDGASTAQLLVQIMDLSNKPWHLALDRTNWKFGRCHINILMLGIIHGKVCLPLFWVLLDKAGNSNFHERIDLIAKFKKAFPNQPIASLSGDREFIGEAWLHSLHEQGIPFVIRLKENMMVWKDGYAPIKLSTPARHLKKKQRHRLNGLWFLGREEGRKTTPVKISMMRLKTGEMLIVASNLIKPNRILPTYRSRWGIETLFSCLKKRGLALEDTHMTDPRKLTTLMAVLTISFCLAYKTGIWASRLKPIRSKAHGRRQRSIFSLGLNALRKLVRKLRPEDIVRFISALFKGKTLRNSLICRVL
jgi:DDE family transposase